jgi:hypothetical protein
MIIALLTTLARADEPATDSPPPAGSCAAPTTVQDLRTALDASIGSWTSFDIPALQGNADAADAALACLGEVIGPEDVAAYWRVQGLVSFSKGDLAGTEVALATAHRVQPAYTLPTDLVPDQHPLFRMWSAAEQAAPPNTRALPAPADGWTQVDGRRSRFAPDASPYVFQWVKTSGVVSTQRVLPGAAPAYAPDRHASRKLLLGGAAAGAVALGGLGAAAALKADYLSAPPEEGLMEGVRSANTALGVTGWSFAAVSAGLTVGAVIHGDW